jgi:hypothetical protein
MLGQSVTLILLALAIENGNAVSPGQPVSSVEADFVQEKRVTFRAWGARSNLALSLDGRALYFCENGPDGLVLKGANLLTGEVRVRAKVNSAYYDIATVPGNPDRVLLAEGAAWGNRSWRMEVVNLETGQENALDIGDRGGDGRLIVSPSGGYVVTGINYGCHTGDRDCFADDLAVISLQTGRKEYQYKVPVIRTKREEDSGGVGGRNVEVTRTSPLNVDVTWAEGDALVISPESSAKSGRVVLQRERDGTWVASKTKPRPVVQAQPQALKLSTGMKWLSVTRPSDASSVSFDATSLFAAKPGRIFAFPIHDRVLVVKEAPDKEGWETVEVVELKWKGGATTR